MNFLRAICKKIFPAATEDIKEPFVVDEVTALIRYASENGIDPGGNTLATLNNAVSNYTALRIKIEKENTEIDENLLKEEIRLAGEIITNYTKLAGKTAPVYGRTLLDTSMRHWSFFQLGILTLLLLIPALGSEIIGMWFADQPEPEEGIYLLLFNIQRYVLDTLGPFMWGALGACVFLLKQLYDFAEDRQFDCAKSHGWFLRVILGGILATVVVYLFDLKTLSGTEEELNANAVAFLIGLGIKVVYGALERLIVLLTEKMDLGAIRRARTKSGDVRNFLNQHIEAAAKTGDEASKQVLMKLLDEFDRKETP